MMVLDVALGNQFVCFCFELLLAFGIVLMFDFFTPDTLGIKYYDTFGDLTLAGAWVYTLAGIAAITLVMPFHTMAGFALYLNRRIELEAWDIEISFRNIASRKQSAAAGAVAMTVTIFFGRPVNVGYAGAG